MNTLEQLQLIKAKEKLQMTSGEAPTIEDFWRQPHGVNLLLIKGAVVDRVPSVVRNRGLAVSKQSLGKMSAYPAHIGTMLSRRRRGRWSVAMATWYSSGWTKLQETTGGAVCTDVEQIAAIARTMGVPVVGLHFNHIEESVGLIEVGADGAIVRNTYLTAVATAPLSNIHHQTVVEDPTSMGLTDALQEIGFDVYQHMLPKADVVTILNIESDVGA